MNPTGMDTVISTRDLILKALENTDTGCDELKHLIRTYRSRITIVTEKEHRLNAVPEDSPEAKRREFALSHAVRLESVCARRIILHILQHHL